MRCSSRRKRPKTGRTSKPRSGSIARSCAWTRAIPPPRSTSATCCDRSGQKVEAEAAYRAATKADAGFAEAWYNLADILDDQGQSDKAVVCLARALDADPDYADALFNLGLLHLRNDRHAEAATCWRRYLTLDQEFVLGVTRAAGA